MTSPLLNAQQVADLLAIDITSVRRMTRHRRIKHVKIGKSVRFRPEDIEAFLVESTREAAS